ncbi:hypothetical protein NQ998_18795, partial [Acinetobacter baumannii]|nr:hypothetical protein [Acinetobacter baumannii]
ASYSIYLVQVFSIPVCYKIFSKIPEINIIFINELYVILCCAVSVISGVLLHFVIEKPIAKLIKKLKFKKSVAGQTQSNIAT